MVDPVDFFGVAGSLLIPAAAVQQFKFLKLFQFIQFPEFVRSAEPEFLRVIWLVRPTAEFTVRTTEFFGRSAGTARAAGVTVPSKQFQPIR
jgi:hypothetical protein